MIDVNNMIDDVIDINAVYDQFLTITNVCIFSINCNLSYIYSAIKNNEVSADMVRSSGSNINMIDVSIMFWHFNGKNGMFLNIYA